ncbi:MAG: M43 family zinc metalloprotease [Brumimicrobium sp.]
MKHLFLLFTLISLTSISSAQTEQFPCSTDEVSRALFLNYPEKQQTIIDARQELKSFTQSFVNQSISTKSNADYIIPVVFHIIHDNGEGNISNEQIYDALKQVNLQFGKKNADTTDIVQAFKNLAADTKIEFRLAQIDPYGNCTNGITRMYSELTNTGGHVVKDLIQWPPNKYVNIWVTNNVGPNLAGHCLMPDVAEAHPNWDGIVIQHSYVGSIGTSAPSKRTVLTHELGHYMNLYHIWGGNNVPEFYYLPVANASNCDFDDEVADTPNTIGWQSCNLSGESCGSLDNVQNYMDYSYCSLMFTIGQKDRMHAALNSPIAGRNNLWTEQNLIETGLLNNTPAFCVAEFESTDPIICEGETVTFSDVSYHGIVSRDWTFEGGDIVSSSDSSVTVTYNTAGKYQVSLTVEDGDLNQGNITKDKYITVLPSSTLATTLEENFEDETAFNEKWYLPSNHGSVNFERINYGKDSDFSIYVDNFNQSGINNNEIRHSIPINTLLMDSKIALSFDYAYAKKSNTGVERIRVRFSNDCGETWTDRRTISLNNMNSVVTDNEFFPSADDWQHYEIDIILSSFKVDNLMVGLKFESNNGNNLFIDNINFFDAQLLSVDSEAIQSRLTISPNPSSDFINVSMDSEFLNGEINIVDFAGKVIMQKQVNQESNVQINISEIASGTYFIRYLPKNETLIYKTQKIVVL